MINDISPMSLYSLYITIIEASVYFNSGWKITLYGTSLCLW